MWPCRNDDVAMNYDVVDMSYGVRKFGMAEKSDVCPVPSECRGLLFTSARPEPCPPLQHHYPLPRSLEYPCNIAPEPGLLSPLSAGARNLHTVSIWRLKPYSGPLGVTAPPDHPQSKAQLQTPE
ncbi:hypothetical protein Pmani_026696 [Petrolisthes manimaculis]|uniref:Uncharacterized protein n=1 Tax=Petrolisthes manimaculis TaxID=1843537 RepID=A0AAE1P2Y7_9EUCA|nr:hypothetical protein Pmani_026696 [Petrolisthes manimaculis]